MLLMALWNLTQKAITKAVSGMSFGSISIAGE
jgi:hypothetical protein